MPEPPARVTALRDAAEFDALADAACAAVMDCGIAGFNVWRGIDQLAAAVIAELERERDGAELVLHGVAVSPRPA